MPRKANILVVDDKPANLLAMEAVLGSEHNLVLAGSGEEALALLRARRDIDLILLDVQMPGLDGFETALQVRAVEHCREVPIIFVTAVYTEDPFIRRGYEVGGIDYFSKPFDPEVLRMKVAVYASFRLKAELLRERELHLRESEELLRAGRKLAALLETLPVGVLIADIDGRMRQATAEVGRILRSSDAEAADAYGEVLRWWELEGQA
ncbi:MAG TPA: response regulator, partial [Burkholderiales bacterium]|nr:response regulator [Burkholderiales bacterium]